MEEMWWSTSDTSDSEHPEIAAVIAQSWQSTGFDTVDIESNTRGAASMQDLG